PVFLDTWLQKQYVMDNQDFYLAFKLNEPKFALHAQDATPQDYKIDIVDMKLYVRQVNVSPSVMLGHRKGLESNNYIMPYIGHKVYTHLIKPGGVELHFGDLFQGVYPKCVIIGLVDHMAYSGSYKLNPYNFQHWSTC